MRRRSWIQGMLGVVIALSLVTQAAAEPPGIPAKARGAIAALDDPDNAVAVNGLLSLFNFMADFPPGTNFAQRDREKVRAFVRGPRMEQLLRDPDPRVRAAAAYALMRWGELEPGHGPLLGALLKDPDASVRSAAIDALGQMGEAAKDQAPLLFELVKSDPRFRGQAAEALGSLGAGAREQAPLLVGLIEDPEEDGLPQVAARALAGMGDAARGQIPRLRQLLKDPRLHIRQAAVAALACLEEAEPGPSPLLEQFLKDPNGGIRQAAAAGLVWKIRMRTAQERALLKGLAPLLGSLLEDPSAPVRETAAAGLGLLGDTAKEQAPLLGRLLKDPNVEVRKQAVVSLGVIGAGAKEQIPLLVELLKDPDVAYSAALTLGHMGEAAKAQAPLLVTLLKDSDTSVRSAAAAALAGMGEVAKDQIPRLAHLLKDPDPEVRSEAATVLGGIGEAAKEQAPLLGSLLKDPNPIVRISAVSALGLMGEAARGQAHLLGDFLDAEARASADSPLSPNSPAADPAAMALVNMAPVELSSLTPLMAQATTSPVFRSDWLLSTYLASGGDPQVVRLLRWVGRPPGEASSASLGIDEARETLQAFAEFWPLTEPYPELRRDLADQIAKVVRLGAGQWERADVELLRLHQQNLEQSGSTQVAAVQEVLGSLQRGNILTNIGWGWVAHAGFWLLLVFFYPRSSRVQALFFWNPWVRTFAGLGYVGLLLTWVPPLRRRLLAPFAPLLLAEADLEHFPARGYFAHSEVVTPSGQRVPLLTALPKLEGQVVLEGDSGLGKSMFLKYLLHGSKRLAVFLPAARCEGGVLEAIQAKLEGQAQDAAFLRSIIYSGALDIYIDGLNEVTASTRERIAQFTERNVHGNILLTTQRIEWTPPATARRYVLQPLTDAQILEFLVSREPLLGQGAKLRGPSYASVCEDFVRQALTPDQPEPLRRAMREVLSNPLDLTVVAQMLAQGHAPDLFHLREQQYALMAREYRSKYLAPFPLGPFCEAAYRMRLEDQPVLPEERFSRELPLLEAFRIVVKRQWKGPDGKDHREWRFRHDKFHEYFIAQALKGTQREHLTGHVGDPRFQGVYLLLAQLLPPAEAEQLRELVVEHAAITRDHSLSDRFVALFKDRSEAETVAREPPAAEA